MVNYYSNNEYKIKSEFLTDLYSLDFNTEFEKLPYVANLMKLFNVKINTIIKLVNKYHIAVGDIFCYSFYPQFKNATLFIKNGIYRVNTKGEKIFSDIYIGQHSYIHCYFVNVVRDLLKLKAPFLFKAPFLIKTTIFKKYKYFLMNENTITIEPNTTLKELSYYFSDSTPVSVLLKILKNPSYLNHEIEVSCVQGLNLYDDCIFLRFDDEPSGKNQNFYQINIHDLITKNLENIENRTTFDTVSKTIKKQSELIDKNSIRYQEFVKFFNK